MTTAALRILSGRPVIFALAFLSFACLLGQFYQMWTMRFFACWILPPATALLVWIGFATRGGGVGRAPHVWITQGTLGGVVAAVAYDLYRLPFVLGGAPLFTVFPRFGQLILGEAEQSPLAHALGWAYHYSNGAALGIMFLALVKRPHPRLLFWGAVTWALFIEAMLLLTPYPTFFGLQLNGRFLFLTASAHLVFGLTLGWWCVNRVPGREPAGDGPTPGPA
jgi:hypothetical protein